MQEANADINYKPHRSFAGQAQ